MRVLKSASAKVQKMIQLNLKQFLKVGTQNKVKVYCKHSKKRLSIL